jgi:hypothetical protein
MTQNHVMSSLASPTLSWRGVGFTTARANTLGEVRVTVSVRGNKGFLMIVLLAARQPNQEHKCIRIKAHTVLNYTVLSYCNQVSCNCATFTCSSALFHIVA